MSDYSIRVCPADNGFTVEVPDMAEIKKREKTSSKGGPSPYYGDATEKYVAKSVKEVLALVKKALAELPDPDMQYADAFAEASSLTADKTPD